MIRECSGFEFGERTQYYLGRQLWKIETKMKTRFRGRKKKNETKNVVLSLTLNQ